MIYGFGELRLNIVPAIGCAGPESDIPVGPQAFDVLRAVDPGVGSGVVPKEEIHDLVWGDRLR